MATLFRKAEEEATLDLVRSRRNDADAKGTPRPAAVLQSASPDSMGARQGSAGVVTAPPYPASASHVNVAPDIDVSRNERDREVGGNIMCSSGDDCAIRKRVQEISNRLVKDQRFLDALADAIEASLKPESCSNVFSKG
jgi:hypothetical protein